MGLYERSLHTHVKFRGSNLDALRGLLAMGEKLGPGSLKGVEVTMDRNLYTRMREMGYYVPAPRSGKDRRKDDRRQGDRRSAPAAEIFTPEDPV